MRETIGNSTLSEALTQGKTEVQKRATILLSSILNQYDAGIRVLAVQLHDVQPPEQVLDAFKDVASAREEKNRMVNEADAYKNELLPKANGLAEETLNKARSYERSAVYAASAEANRFLKVFEEYQKAPDITRKRMYIETMEDILSQPGLEKIIVPQDRVAPVMPYMPLDRMPRPSVNSAETSAPVQDKETRASSAESAAGKRRTGGRQ
jgi:modulator of FtsH protease HflK